jgi:hypothetical protein
MGMENVIASNGFGLALVGMSLVFAGLLLVSLYVALLPRIFAWLDRPGRREASRSRAADAAVMERESSLGMDPSLLAAIGYVFQAERERQLALDHQEITLRDDDEQRVWTAIGKMRTLSKRM